MSPAVALTRPVWAAARSVVCLAIAAAVAVPVHAAVIPRDATRFDAAILFEPATRLGTVAERPGDLSGFDAERAGWEAFGARNGGGWAVWVDRRSGAPTLVEGPGIRFLPAGATATLAGLEEKARAFLQQHAVLMRLGGSELVLDADGSSPVDADRWIVAFTRRHDGVPVEGERLTLYVTRGNLVAFGMDRWGALHRTAHAVYGVETTRELLFRHAGIVPGEPVEELVSGELSWIAAPPSVEAEGRWHGPVGEGIDYRLVRTFALRVPGTRGTWVGKVDAVTGEVVSFHDDDKYAFVRGGAFPISNDGNCAQYGCEVPGYPMPYTNMTIDGVPQPTTGDMGQFECSPAGGNAVTTLFGPYVRVTDNCGAVSQAVTCDDDLGLGESAGTDCAVPAGSSPGNTHSARTGFWRVNRLKEKARYYLPSNTWATIQTRVNTNVNSQCNATWGGNTLNMYKSGGGCGNTGEIAAVIDHEYGHGLDENDGGGFDNPSEAYGDVVAILEEHRSCVGRGFYIGNTCDGYGDTCLTCTGIRDMDWDARQAHTAATPANFTQPNCPGGGGPCGREVHCEAYPPAEAVYDLAARDLPASGMDAASSWQLAEKLFYKSRQGSGGNAMNCSLPSSDGCGASNWFTKFRNADDDDGNLSNGTPHAAAIFAAFDRHAIACGTAASSSNQNSSTCPALAAPTVTGTPGSQSVTLNWGAVASATNYLVFRTEVGCDYAQNVIATVAAPTTTYTDTDVPDDFPVYYRVQAQGANTACDSPVSACIQVTPQPFAGAIKLDRGEYSCSSLITVTVRDANVGAPSIAITVASTSESTPEIVIVTQTAPGSAKYTGTLTTTGGPSGNGDGLLQIAHGDTITAQYVDADDGLGGVNLLRQTTAVGDCVGPQITQVSAVDILGDRARITWTTGELSNTRVIWGQVAPPTTVSSDPVLVSSHSLLLTGLQSCTIYWYRVESTDRAGNVAGDDNSGQYFYFETLGDLGSGLQSCHAGRLTITPTEATCSGSLPFTVTDLDVNVNPLVADTVQVQVSSTTEFVPETVTLTETGPNTSRFTGAIPTAAGAPVAADGVLQTAPGDTLTATYRDADDGAGHAAVSFDTASADCQGPKVTSMTVTYLGDDRAQVQWSLDEPATGAVDYGPTPALGSTANSTGGLALNHTVLLSNLAECGRVHFRVRVTDDLGQQTIHQGPAGPLAFNVRRYAGVIFKDDFESGAGWTLQGEWQIGTPGGLGTPADPALAFAGTKVLGHDLTGLGANPGNYEPGTTQTATSPVINASSLVNGRLMFRRWLNVNSPGATSNILVKRGAITLPAVFSTTLTQDGAWQLQTVDIAAIADGAPAIQVQFQQIGGSGPGPKSGWNLDRVLVRTANGPENEACGGCAGTPTFEGALTAVDPAPCADTGIQLSWRAAPAWGTGATGAYAIYRSTDPGFTPGPANLIVDGVAGTTHLDASAPNGVTLYYVVRAENDETCGGGPNNGGAVDGNLVRLSATDQISQPAPGDVGDALRGDKQNGAHVRLSWTSTPGAAVYNVYRALGPQGPFTKIATVAGTSYEDLNQLGNTTSYSYSVRAEDACGNEGP